MKLNQDQIEFITSKVHELGSIENVIEFYNNNDNVSKFAIKKANEIYKRKKLKLKIKKGD